MAEKKVVKKVAPKVETPDVKVENTPAAVEFLKVVEAYKISNPKKAAAKAAEFEAKLAVLNK